MKAKEGKTKLHKILVHIPVGLVTCALAWLGWVYGLLFGFGFIAYEWLEDDYLHDKPYIDVQGWLIGLALGGGIMIGLRLGGIL